jgi:hypothetical protein
MRHRSLSLAVAASLLLALPAAAEVYTIRLSNGSVFESRYQPKQASWDPTQVTFIDETGLEISLPQSLISDVTAQSETKGYGRVLDTATVDLGFMPNDLDQSQQAMQAQAMQMSPFQQQLVGGLQQSAFLEPGEPGQAGGIPLGFGAFPGSFGGGSTPPTSGGGFNVPSGTTPAPFTTPTNTVTPPPFTIPSPGTASPPTTGQGSQQ